MTCFWEYFWDSAEAESQKIVQEYHREQAERLLAMGIGPEIVSETFKVPVHQTCGMLRRAHGKTA